MKFPIQTLMLTLSLVGLLIAEPIKDKDPGLNVEEIENSMMKSLEERDPKKEIQENIKRKKLVFYCTGSFMDGYSVPGLTQEEVEEFINSQAYGIENHYQTDPMPVFQPKGYYEMKIEFMESYNKLLLEHIKNKHIKSVLTTPDAARPTS